jgi:hypothetical protein
MHGRRSAKWSVTLAVIIAACSSEPKQMYPGPALERDQVALLQLEHAGAASVFALDGERASGASWYLAPGPHMIWARARAGGGELMLRFKIVGYCLMRLDAAPGGTYTLVPDIHKSATAGSIQVDVGVNIVDQTGKVVQMAAPCLGGRPSLH